MATINLIFKGDVVRHVSTKANKYRDTIRKWRHLYPKNKFDECILAYEDGSLYHEPEPTLKQKAINRKKLLSRRYNTVAHFTLVGK